MYVCMDEWVDGWMYCECEWCHGCVCSRAHDVQVGTSQLELLSDEKGQSDLESCSMLNRSVDVIIVLILNLDAVAATVYARCSCTCNLHG